MFSLFIEQLRLLISPNTTAAIRLLHYQYKNEWMDEWMNEWIRIKIILQQIP